MRIETQILTWQSHRKEEEQIKQSLSTINKEVETRSKCYIPISINSQLCT